ncbi:hypothetical protein [Neoaquamicrobium sediminum]|uniref:hypothetical protein n=1 Tax=Neoaquamicrobium sediminum TaxID=1849104 RepID=UPI003BAC18D7
MSAYNKAIAAILSTLIMRWIARYLGFDPASMGLEGEIVMVIDVAIDGAFAAFNGFWVWLLPNRPGTAPPKEPG